MDGSAVSICIAVILQVTLTQARQNRTFTLFTKPTLNWQTAVTFCRDRGQELVRITSKEEQDFITSLGQSGGLWYNKITGKTWSSLHDPDTSTEGEGYRWQLRDPEACRPLTPTSWTSWYPGEPLNARSSPCINLEWDNGQGLRWRTGNCQDKLQKVICRAHGGDCYYEELADTSITVSVNTRLHSNKEKSQCAQECTNADDCYAAEWTLGTKTCLLHLSDSPFTSADMNRGGLTVVLIPHCLAANLNESPVSVPADESYNPRCSENAATSTSSIVTPQATSPPQTTTPTEATTTATSTAGAPPATTTTDQGAAGTTATTTTTPTSGTTVQETGTTSVPEPHTSEQHTTYQSVMTSSSLLHTTTQHQGSPSSGPTTDIAHHCACCVQVIQTTVNETEQKEIISNIVKELTIDQKQTSATRRKYISIPDSRPTAETIGSLGVAILVLVFGSIVALDITSLCCREKKGGQNKDEYNTRS